MDDNVDEAANAWLAGAEEAGLAARSVREAIDAAAQETNAARIAETVFQEALTTLAARQTAAEAADAQVHAAMSGVVDPNLLIARVDAEELSRGAIVDAIAQSEVAAQRFEAATQAVLARAEALSMYGKLVALSEGRLDAFVEQLQDSSSSEGTD